MSAIVFTERGGACGICLEKFSSGEKQYTHEGGKHDGFHKNCLKEWLNIQTKCPYDRENIDPNSLISRTEKVMRMLKAPLENAAYATAIGGGVLGGWETIRALGGATVESVSASSLALGAVALVGGGAREVREAALGLLAVLGGAGLVIAGALAVGGALARRVVVGEEEELGAAGLAVLVLGAAAGAGAGLRGAWLGVAAVLGGLILGDYVRRILDRRGVDLSTRLIIAYAIGLGRLAGAPLAQYDEHPITAIIRASLTGGCVAGILSMLKPYFRR